jgi:hypothetical protein
MMVPHSNRTPLPPSSILSDKSFSASAYLLSSFFALTLELSHPTVAIMIFPSLSPLHYAYHVLVSLPHSSLCTSLIPPPSHLFSLPLTLPLSYAPSTSPSFTIPRSNLPPLLHSCPPFIPPFPFVSLTPPASPQIELLLTPS